jgi:EAL domain-containing protein (putative c-di-GMP-specific phosphodiesterase class I)/GGDEF domain-containing protein
MTGEPQSDCSEAAAVSGYVNLLDTLDRFIADSDVHGRRVGLLLIDMSRIDMLYPSLGYKKVSQILDSIQASLQQIKRQADSLLRLNEHRFALIIADLKFPGMAELAANKIHNAIDGLQSLTGIDTAIHPATGAALFPEHGRTAETLVLEADAALQTARSTNESLVYAGNKQNIQINRSRSLEACLEPAFKDCQFELHYQPKVNLVSRQIFGAEALLRWNHPAYGMILPDIFIPVVENSPLLPEITLWALNTALRQSMTIRERSPDFRTAVNISPRLLDQPDLVDLVSRALKTWDTDPQSLILEVTETSMMVNHEISQQNLKKLSESGVMLSIDDFGTGYSSYSYLQQLPVQEMKIDQSFVREMLSNSNSERLIRSMINLGHDMGINVLVEGIETPEEMTRLRELGCVYGQGFLIGKPMPFDEIHEWIETSEWG